MGLTNSQAVSVLSSYDSKGFGYWPTFTDGMGDCVCSPEWVSAQLDEDGLRLIERLEASW